MGAVAALQETTRAAMQLQQERAAVSARRAKARGDSKPSRMWHVPALAPNVPACSEVPGLRCNIVHCAFVRWTMYCSSSCTMIAFRFVFLDIIMPAHCWDNIETADHRWLAAYPSKRDSMVKTCIAAQVPECSGLGQKQRLRCQSGISIWQAGEYINLLSSCITRLQPSLCSFMLRMIGCHCTVQPARLRRPCGAACWLFCASGLVHNRLLRLMISELKFLFFISSGATRREARAAPQRPCRRLADHMRPLRCAAVACHGKSGTCEGLALLSGSLRP